MNARGAAAAALAVALLAVALVSGPRSTRGQEGEAEAGAGSVERGAALYQASCATCHGASGEGAGPWPSIVGAGAAGADFQLRTGRMPFAGEVGQQALPKPPAYDEQQIRDLVAFVALLGDGPPIPDTTVDGSLVPHGRELFSANCAPCHGATGNGGAVGAGAIALPLTRAEPLVVAEAMITGPGQMPVFDLPDDELNAVVSYVAYLQEAPNPGGLAIGGIGPVPEGFVAWLVGMSLLVVIVYLIGREWQPTERVG